MSMTDSAVLGPGQARSQTAPTRPLRAAAICVSVAVIAFTVPFAEHALVVGGVLGMLLCLIVPAWYRWQSGRFDAFETIHVVGFVYFVFFGLGSVWTQSDPSQVAYDKFLLSYLPRSTLYCLVGYVALLAGYFGPWFGPRAKREQIIVPTGTRFLAVLTAIGFAGGLSKVIWSTAKDLGTTSTWYVSTLNQLTPLFFFVWALGCILVMFGRATPGQRRIFWFALVPGTALFLGMSLSDKSLAMTLIGVPVMTLWYVKRRLPWVSLTALVLLLIFGIFPFYNTFRSLDPHLPRGRRVGLTLSLARTWDRHEYMENSVGKLKERLSVVNSVAVVVRDTEKGWVEYAGGDTLFLPSMVYFIPRAFWRDKPTFRMGREFGEKFRVVHILDPDTNIAVTVPGELYWNFGLTGIVLGMGLWGVALRGLYRRYGEGLGVDPIRLAVHMLLLIQFVHFGGGLAAEGVTVFRTIVLIEVFCWVSLRLGLLTVQPVPQGRDAALPS